MPKTAVGLFKKGQPVEDVIREIEGLGLPRREIRTLDEPETFDITGLMSFPRLDFELGLRRELDRLGASRAQADAYIEGLQHGGTLLFATDPEDAKVDAAAEVMNRNGAIGVEEASGGEPDLPHATPAGVGSFGERAVLTGRVRQTPGSACVFVW